MRLYFSDRMEEVKTIGFDTAIWPLICRRFTVHVVTREDLKMYPRNIWGLLGLHQCLEEAGKGADPEV